MHSIKSFFMLIISFLLVLQVCNASSDFPKATWIWNVDSLWTNLSGNYTLSIYNPTSDYIQIERVGLHYPWDNQNIFFSVTSNKTVLSGETGEISFSFIVPDSFTTGATNDFAAFFFYHNSSNISIDGGLFRALQISIGKRTSIYSAQPLSQGYVSSIFLLSVSTCVVVYVKRKKITQVLETHSKSLPIIIFLMFSLLFISSTITNFYPYLINIPLQGVPITGDEPHYIYMTRGLLMGKYLSSDIYPPYTYHHDMTAYGLLDYEQAIPAHPIGFPIVLLPSYAIGSLFGSGSLGSSMFVGIITALSLVLIYKITLEITKSISLSVTSALIFGFATLVATWANQLFTESFMGFIFLYISYALLIKKDKHLVLAGFLLGFVTMLKYQIIFQVLISAIVIFILLLRYDKVKAKEFIISFAISIVILTWYSISFLGLQGFFYSFSSNVSHSIISLIPITIFGLLIDSSYGALFYSPILILSFVGFYSFFKKCDRTLLAFVMMTVVFWCGAVSISNEHGYWNGWLAPPGRYMMVVLPMLCVPFAYSLQRIKTYFVPIGIALFSIGVVFNITMLFNRYIAYVMFNVDGVGRSRILVAITNAYNINIVNFPDFVYYYPQNNFVMYGWSIAFLIVSVILIVISWDFSDMFVKHEEKAT